MGVASPIATLAGFRFMHLEFVAVGIPVSNQSPGPGLQAWKATVRAAAMAAWGNQAILAIELKAILIHFYKTKKPPVDLDNMSKPILDELENIVYDEDRQVRQLEIAHLRINDPFVFVGVSPILVSAIVSGNPFVYTRIEDPVTPFPLPG